MTTRLTSSRGRPPTSSRPISSHKGAGYSNGGLQTSGGKKVISPLDHVADSFSQFLKDTHKQFSRTQKDEKSLTIISSHSSKFYSKLWLDTNFLSLRI